MKSSVLAMALAAATAAPSPTPAPVTDLREIARVRAVTPFCKAVVQSSTDAVSDAFNADANISLLVSSLAHIDLDSSAVANTNGLREMQERYNTLHDTTVRGEKMMKDLRAKIAASTDPAERAALQSFANALGGAIGRQATFLKAYARVYTTAQAMQPRANLMYNPQNEPRGVNTQNPMNSPGTVSSYVRNELLELERDLPAIAADEDAAAVRAAPAFDKCNNALPAGDASAAPAPS